MGDDRRRENASFSCLFASLTSSKTVCFRYAYRSGTDMSWTLLHSPQIESVSKSLEELPGVEVVETGSIDIQLFNIIDTTD